MPTPKRRRSRSRPVRGERWGETHQPYRHGATGSTRPAKDDTYTLDGTEHRYDGKCHPDCENVR